jgi:hypothetical protein
LELIFNFILELALQQSQAGCHVVMLTFSALNRLAQTQRAYHT